MEATPIPKESIRAHTFQDVEDDAEFVTDNGEGGWWSSDKPTFERQWMNEHPGSDYRAYYESEERKPRLSVVWRKVSRRLKMILELHLIW